MQSVIETEGYLRAAKDTKMAEEEMVAAVDLVSTDPEAGDVMAGTGGVRKARLAGRGKRKSAARASPAAIASFGTSAAETSRSFCSRCSAKVRKPILVRASAMRCGP